MENTKKILLASLVVMLMFSAYLVGKIQTLSTTIQPQKNSQVESVKTELTPTFTPIPTPVPKTNTKTIQKVSASNTPSPTVERKKVPIYLDDAGGITKGTFYCYEDKVNYLSNQQNLIRIKDMAVESCTSQAKFEGDGCVTRNCKPLTDINEFSSCTDKCYKEAYSKCNSSEIGQLREQFFKEVQQFCP